MTCLLRCFTPQRINHSSFFLDSLNPQVLALLALISAAACQTAVSNSILRNQGTVPDGATFSAAAWIIFLTFWVMLYQILAILQLFLRIKIVYTLVPVVNWSLFFLVVSIHMQLFLHIQWLVQQIQLDVVYYLIYAALTSNLFMCYCAYNLGTTVLIITWPRPKKQHWQLFIAKSDKHVHVHMYNIIY